MKLIFNPQFSTRLYKISSKIVERAFLMGGYKMLYFEAERCHYIFPNGKACFNPDTLSASVDCPICGGTGVIYKDPVETVGIAIDREAKTQRINLGVSYIDNLRIVVKAEIPVKIVKTEANGKVFIVRDKFQIFSSSENVWHTVYVDSEPRDVWLAGILYKAFNAKSHVVSNRDAEGNKSIHLSPIEEYMSSTNFGINRVVVNNNEENILDQIVNSLIQDFGG